MRFDITGVGTRPETEKVARHRGSGKMKRWRCILCGYVYDEARGEPEDGIQPGTRWEDVPESWSCPDCGAGKEDFEHVPA